ncbi:MAG: GNAT family N-acetyltransferase, partial [Promethearchaeota archaeon]
MAEKFIVKEYRDEESIFNHIHLGTNLPVLESFRKYVNKEISRMGCFSFVVLNEEDEIIGHSMLYAWKNTLYFAFFYAKDDSFQYTQFLLEQIKNHAENLNCDFIFGPANLPPYIFGFGFSDNITDKSPFAMAPTTNPVYIDHFQKCGFSIKQGISTYKIPMAPITYEKKWDVRSADFSKADEWKQPFLELQQKLYPVTIQITPNRAESFYDVIEFIDEFAYDTIISFAFVDEKIIGLGWACANPFDLGENGKSKSLVLFGGAVEPQYQSQGVVTQILFQWIDTHWKLGVAHGESCISDENTAARKLMERWAGKPTRHH